ncbi:LysR family transcriptional regulator [Acrocarpospora pleiomorpha]|uniref:LysR family transcriptional regulator n=1 Tax=Acrocarpospora pleiomorpha TaxID=90975 RepID=A0A5M3XCY2_9ACTN|nr:LysR family transcriptional regulator [Acrocarpospora pleiomorpha]GES18632.1 LysR family transcriptional regulator [Acrocarpospora pleiomorpha]
MKAPSFTLVQLRYFAAAAELGSMTAAARELVVSQSAVSTAVAQLEKELGVQLLLRHHARGLALTPAGRVFYSELRGFLAHSQELADSATNAGRELVGTLTVGCFDTLAPFWLPHLVARYAEQHPAVSVEALEAQHAALKQSLRSGRCEVALMYAYELDEDFETTRVGSAPPYLLLPPGHRLAHRTHVHLAELAEDPVVMLELPDTSTYFHSLFKEVGVEPRVRHRTAGYETVRSMVAAGHGYAVLNQRPAHSHTYGGGSLVTVALADDFPALDVVAVRMKQARLTRKAEAFVQVCREIGTLMFPGPA